MFGRARKRHFASCLAAGTLCILSAQAQQQQVHNVSANFGNFYGANGQPHYVDVMAHMQGTYTNPQTSGTCSTPSGSVSFPNQLYNQAGQGTFMLQVTFNPTMVDGGLSGVCTVTYTGQNEYGPATLTYNVSLGGYNKVPVSTAGLKYKILSILYDPPGSSSTNGFTNTVSAGSTEQSIDTFSTTNSITFSGGFLAEHDSIQFSTTQAHGFGSSSQTTYQATSGSQLSSIKQAIDHNQDQIYLLIDPSVYLVQTSDVAGFYSFGPSVDATGFQGAVPSDVLNVSVAALKNPSLLSLDLLKDQVPIQGTTLPGLKYVCANPLPDNQCTQANACGCTAADFAPIVAEDTLANVTDQTIAPSSIDTTRFVYIDYVQLQGPPPGGGDVKSTFQLSDQSVSSQITSNGHSYSVAYKHAWKVPVDGSLGIDTTHQFTFQQQTTAGSTNGTAHVGVATMGSSSVGCFEYVDVYEDTVYHTFAFALPTAPPQECQ